MKDFNKPPFKQKAVAIGFTLGVHIVAVVGLLYLGMSKPPEPPKKITTVLVKPEDLKPVTREVTEFDETAHENVAKQIRKQQNLALNQHPRFQRLHHLNQQNHLRQIHRLLLNRHSLRQKHSSLLNKKLRTMQSVLKNKLKRLKLQN
jgi:hypothetical protein